MQLIVNDTSHISFLFQDRHATATTLPLMDTQQDYQSLYGAENATHTVLKFKRKLATCDPDDWQITNDTVKLIWSFNPTDVENENQFSMHTQRGTRSIMLLEPSKSSRGRMPLDVFTFDVNVTNVSFLLFFAVVFRKYFLTALFL